MLDFFLKHLKSKGFAIPDMIWNGFAFVDAINGKLYLFGWYKINQEDEPMRYKIPLLADSEILPW